MSRMSGSVIKKAIVDLRCIMRRSPDRLRGCGRGRTTPSITTLAIQSSSRSKAAGRAVATCREQPAALLHERIMPSSSLSAHESVFSIDSPCMWRTTILVMIACV